MGKKVNKFLKGQIATSIFYIVFGLCLVLMPVKTVDVLCKVVFGLLLIGSGLYHIYIFVREKDNTTILDLFSGVLVLVIGGFLFTNPQVVIKLLPVMLGAFVLVDSIWTMRGGLKLKKRRLASWKAFLVESLIFIVLGVFLIAYPFQSVNVMLMFAGWIFLCNGVLDLILYIILQKGMKKEITAEESTEEKTSTSADKEAVEKTEESVDVTEKEEKTSEKISEEIRPAEIAAEDETETEIAAEVVKDDTELSGKEEISPETEQEVLEEWRD